MKPGAIRRPRRDAAATRARILRSATAEFAREGFAGARGGRIAARARSSERMVYYYFSSKEGLFRAVLESTYLELRQAEHSLELDDLAPREALATFCRFVWRWYLDHPEFIGVVGAENAHQARHLKKSARLAELVSPVVGMLDRLLRRGETAGEFRAGIDPAQLYLTIAAQGYFYLSNLYTLSAVLGVDLKSPERLEMHWRESERIVLQYVSAHAT